MPFMPSVPSASVPSESRVFLPLTSGVVPFPLQRSMPSLPMRFSAPTSHPAGECEATVAATPSTRSELRLAAATARLVRALCRLQVRPATTPAHAVQDVEDDAEPVWFTSPDNWRPGLLTLEQAARRTDVVRRPEAFEVP